MFTRARHWLNKPRFSKDKRFSFSLTCDCGRTLSGPRLETPQVCACPGCGAEKFILPMGPWLELAGALYPEQGAAPQRAFTWRDLLLPGAATLLALAILLFGYHVWIMPVVFPDGAETAKRSALSQVSGQEHLARARKYVSEGSFRLAFDELNQDRKDLTSAERRDWQQLFRQAALLADLLSEPLEDILRHGAGVREQEWQADFKHRYQGKSLILDAEFRRPVGGAWEVHYPLYHGRDRARIIVADLKLLQLVPGRDMQRLIVGARLASVRLELPGPSWVVRLEPDSGVFLTDAAAAALVCPPLGQPDATIILERQKGWVEP